ncbi:peptidoglycan/LPS O-acetylase OafA/YrhL [Bradyrhizobium sp. LB7.2]
MQAWAEVFGAGCMQGQTHNNNFDIIRILAALQVLYSHAIEVLNLPVPTWWVHLFFFWFPGVPVFFLVSGFLVVQSFQNCNRSARPFWIRRALRLYPGLVVNLLVILALLTIAGNISGAQWINPATWLWLLVSTAMGSDFYGNIVVGAPFTYDGAFKVFPSGVLWSISVEIGFYLLVPLTFGRPFHTRLSMTVSLMLWATFSVLASRFLQDYWTILPTVQRDILFCSPFPHYWIFLVGAAVRLYWDEIQALLKGWGLAWLTAYVALSLVLFMTNNGQVVDYQHVTPLVALRVFVLAGLVFSAAFTLPRLASVLRGNDLSYGVYLYHMPVIATFVVLGVAPSDWLWIAVLATTVAVAVISWRLVEKRALALKQRAESCTKIDWTSLPRMAAALPGLSFAVAPTAIVAVALASMFFWNEATGRDTRNLVTGPQIFALARTTPGMALNGASVEWRDGRMILTTDTTNFGNQWKTPDLVPTQRSEYLLSIDVTAADGHVGVGVLDAGPNGQWVHTISQLPEGKSLVRFWAVRPFSVVLFNNNVHTANVTARVAELTISAIR